jgi:glycosyltransferase involved in cell wall biosynthesis
VFTYHTKFDIDIANAIHSKRLQEASIKLLVENISACDEVWTVSHGAGENLRSLGYQGDYIVMPNGVDIPADRLPEETVRAVSEGLDLPEGVPLLLFVGRMMWYKGLRIILDALKQLKDEGQDFRMVFIGKGTDGEAIRAYAEELCLGDKVFFLPPCYDREIIRAWYCRADLFLFPSTFDTNGLVVREAAACGLASVLIAGSCAAEDVTDGRNGFFIEENAASMAAMLRCLLPQRELLRQVGENARRELYISWDTSVANACRRYEVVLDNFRRGVYPARDTRVDELLLDTAESLDAINRLRAIPQQLRAAMDEDVRQWHDEIQENRLNARENRQKLQEKLSQLRQQIDRYL